ncbi:MAG: hypothetical protein K2I64_00995, partial [Muribaculaceae bacterium]|nr:hypothetical protein [Muribaculaceae bacterium]
HGVAPLLLRRTEKEWTSTGYRVNSVEENYYSRTGSPSRTVRTRYFNESKDIYSAPGFYFNGSLLPSGKTFYPLGSSTSCGDESVTATTLTSEYATGINMQEAAMMGVRRLPWAERWVVRTSAGSDSLFRHYHYSFRTVGGKRFMRPDAVTVEVIPSGNSSKPALDVFRTDTVSVQRYEVYDARGRIREMTDAAGRYIKASWDTCYDYLTLLSLPDVGQTTTYTYRPLVGCTSITSPSGRKRQFGYVAGRLASERNTAGQTVATYSYRLFGDGSDSADPANRFTATLHDDSGEASQTVDYDGFGLPVRTVADVAGGGQTSTAVEYDALDRPVRQYLPVPCSGGVAQDPKTYYGDNFPYRTTTYRPLRTDAPLSVIAEGALMQSHPATVEYLCNTTSGDASLRCRRYRLGSSATSETVTLSGNYPAGALDVTRSTDPDGHRVLTFTDWRGFKILERRIVDAAKSEFADTYWLYDPMGRVRVIIQPEGSGLMTATGSSWTNSSAPLKQYAFISRYDRRGNCIYSLTPGGGPVRMAYDPLNRLALRQTASMAERGEAEFMLYDPVGCPAVTGIMQGNIPADGLATLATVTFAGSETGICGSGYVASSQSLNNLLSDATLTTATYYDSYACAHFEGFEDLYFSFSINSSYAKGLKTAEKVAVYNSDNRISDYRYTIYAYDQEGRVAASVASPIIQNEITIARYEYSRQGHLTKSITSVEFPDTTYTLYQYNTLDATGNILKAEASMSPGKVNHLQLGQSIITHSYNSLGLLSETILMPVLSRKNTYTYNLRGQLKSIGTPGFVQTLNSDEGPAPCFNGNISSYGFGYEYDAASGSVWETDMVAFQYDGLNRLTASVSTDGYNTLYDYDHNSSPVEIKRWGMTSDGSVGLVDDMSMLYDGNRLALAEDVADRVVLENSLDFDSEDGVSFYEYDNDGRMVSDSGSGIVQIDYAPNDMPVAIRKESGTITHRYLADGTKVMRSVSFPAAGRTRAINHYYIGPFQFTNNSTIRAIRLERVNLPWGYFDANLTPMVNLTDYQGNIRGVFSQYHGMTMQTTDYYPYGLPKATSTNPTVNAYKYGGKELNTDFGIDCYDFEARLQYPSQLRFNRPDPLAGDNPGVNTYLYCNANPIILTDPTGENPVYNQSGEYLGCTEEGFTGEVFIYTGSDNVDFSKMSITDAQKKFGSSLMTFDAMKSKSKSKLSGEAMSNVWTHIVSQFDGLQVYDEIFTLSDLKEGRISYISITHLKKAGISDTSWYYNRDKNSITGTGKYRYESTIENIALSLIVHEWYAHKIKDYGDKSHRHRFAYLSVMGFHKLWDKATEKYKKSVINKYNDYKAIEIKSPSENEK